MIEKDKLDVDIESILEIFPKHKYASRTLVGEIDIYDNEDRYYSSFNIKITIPLKYPYEFPILYESGNKIPHIIDRHIYKNGSCCVCITQEEDIRCKRGITIKEFIFEYVIPFFANQIYFEVNGKWANGDYQHGYDGVIQFYQELFNTKDLNIIIEGFKCYFYKRLKPYEKCFCGSNIKYKKCHLLSVYRLQEISLDRLMEDYKFLLLTTLICNHIEKK